MSIHSDLLESIKKGKDKAIQIYEMLPNYCSPEDIPELLEGLRDAMKSYVMTETRYGDLKTAKQKVMQEVTKSVKEDSKELISQEEIEQMLKNALAKEFEKHPEGYCEKDRMYASMKDFSPEGQHQNNVEMEDDDGLAVTGVTVLTIDPYTKREFVDPVKNIKCGHPYERATIMELIQRGTAKKCYHMGCNNRLIKAEDLVPDEDLKRQLARMRARVAPI